MLLCTQGCRFAPTAGLKLANAFGVKKLANASGVSSNMTVANAFGVRSIMTIANAYGVSSNMTVANTRWNGHFVRERTARQGMYVYYVPHTRYSGIAVAPQLSPL